MRIASRRLKRARLLPLSTCLAIALLVLYRLGAHARNTTRPAEPGRHTVQSAAPGSPLEAMLEPAQVARGQAFFYSYPEACRLASYETWRPREGLARAAEDSEQPVDNSIFVVVQSSAASVWRNVPALLMTVLREFPHFAVYSYAADSVGTTEVRDAVALLDADFVAHSPHLEAYRVLRIVRDSHVNVPLDELPVVGAAALARFVTLPMLHHAYTNHAEHEWYVVALDSTYLFGQNLRAVLAELDPNEPLYLGSAVQGPDIVFADIGSGIVLSREAARRAFADADIAAYTERAASASRSDYALALYLRERLGLELDVARSRGQFQGNAMHRVPVSAKNWCTRIVSARVPHPRDLDTLAEYARLKRQRALTYSDIYLDFIKPYVPSGTQQNWDNGAADLEFAADSGEGADSDAYRSLDNCRAACTRYTQCVMMRYDAYQRRCGLGLSTVSLGGPIIRYETGPDEAACAQHGAQCSPRGADEPTTSEWLIDRLRAMRATLECDPLHADAAGEGAEFGALDQVEGWWHRARRLTQDADPLRANQKGFG